MGERDLPPVTYLDNAATSWPKPPCVQDAMIRALTEFGSPGRGAHRLALAASRAVADARSTLAKMLGVPDSRDLMLQCGCTQALNVMLQGLLESGDRVVVSSMEHNAVVRPLHVLAKRGVQVDVVHADAAGLVDANAFETEVRRSPTRAIVCQHVSNITGAVQPIADLTDIAHANDALMLVDGAQAVGHLDVDVAALGVDAYAASGHKGLLGPQGVGVLYLAEGANASPLIFGGTGSRSESPEQPRERPSRYEAGTPGLPAICGLDASVRWLAEEAARIRERERKLTRDLVEGLAEMADIHVLGPAADEMRTPIVAFVSERLEPDRLAYELDDRWGIASRPGLHCAPWAHETIGTLDSGALRLGLGWDSTNEDIEMVLDALREMHP